MKPIESIEQTHLEWVQLRVFARDFELRAIDDPVAMIYWPGLFSSKAIAKTVDREWHLSRRGILNQTFVMINARTEQREAWMDLKWSGEGMLHLPGKRSYKWERTRFWRNRWTLINQNGMKVFEIQPSGFLRYGADVIVESWARETENIAGLLVAGWYLVYMKVQDTAIAAS